MAVRRKPFGMVNGQAVERYRLVNAHGLVAEIMSYGATLLGLYMPDRAGQLADVVVGFGELEPFTRPHPYFGSLVGRFCNRIAHGRFELDGKMYQLSCNDGQHHLHGGPEGFHRKVWRAEMQDGLEGSAVALSLHSPDGDEAFPGALDVTVTYILTDDNELCLDYRATTNSPTILNLTNHAYFNLAGAESVLEHELMVNGSYYIPTDASAIPLGELAAVEATPMDFRKPMLIGSRINDDDEQLQAGRGYDHCWVIDKQPGELGLAARLYDPGSGRVLELLTTQPGIQIYSGNYLDGSLIGKHGRPIGYRAGLCLETQHFPDSPNQPGFPSTVLRPGDVFRETTVWRMRVDG